MSAPVSDPSTTSAPPTAFAADQRVRVGAGEVAARRPAAADVRERRLVDVDALEGVVLDVAALQGLVLDLVAGDPAVGDLLDRDGAVREVDRLHLAVDDVGAEDRVGGEAAPPAMTKKSARLETTFA